MASGELAFTFSAHCLTMFVLMFRRSSRLIPGLRATPAVMTTISDPAVSS